MASPTLYHWYKLSTSCLMSGQAGQHRRFPYSMLIECILIIKEITYGLVHFGIVSTASTTQHDNTITTNRYCCNRFILC